MTNSRNFFRRGTEAFRGRLHQGLHSSADALRGGLHRAGDAVQGGLQRGADALDKGLGNGADALDKQARNGAEAFANAGERVKRRWRRRQAAEPDAHQDPGAEAGTETSQKAPLERNRPDDFPNNHAQGASAAPAWTPPACPTPPLSSSEHSDDPNPKKTMCIFRSILRIGAIGGLLTAAAVGGTVLVAGPDRSAALFDKAKSSVVEHIDLAIDDPAALRAQLKELEGQYPERISMLRGDLAELQQQIRSLHRDQAISERVVALAERDIKALEPQLQTAQSSNGPHGTQLVAATVQLENRVYTVNQASTRLNQIQQTRIAYANRAADASHDLVYLENQAERLSEMLAQLETERAQFQAQIAQLERQVDAVARNERLIGMLEKRQRTLEDCSRYEAESLDQIVARLSEVRSRQEATLEYLTGDQRRQDYESIARLEIEETGMQVNIEVPNANTSESAYVIR